MRNMDGTDCVLNSRLIFLHFGTVRVSTCLDIGLHTLIRRIAFALSSSVKNQAFVGESGNRKLPIRELAKNDAMLGVLTKT